MNKSFFLNDKCASFIQARLSLVQEIATFEQSLRLNCETTTVRAQS